MSFTPDPDLDDRLREISRRTNKPISAVINGLLRSALKSGSKGAPKLPPLKIVPHDFRPRPGYDLVKPSELLYRLEVEEQTEAPGR